jgi:hypothetical protein
MFGGGVRESAKAAGIKSTAHVVRKREARPVKTPHEAKWRILAKKLPKLSEEELQAFPKSIDPRDRAAFIEAVLAQAGPDGIPPETMSVVGEILEDWASEDFDGAWAWASCRSIESDANRKFVASKLLDGLLVVDLDRAFALHLEMAAEDSDFRSEVPIAILQKCASKDAASFVDLLGHLPFGSSTTYTGMKFATDFDFQQAAEGITALQKSHEGKSPPAFPTNFLSK